MDENIKRFILYCQKIQPQDREDIRIFFEGVVCFPYDNELLLQAFLFFNVKKLFPLCKDILLLEKAPFSDRTDLGKCDFVYLTQQDSLLLIETKFIDTNASGATERKKRNHHRNKVIEQVFTLKQTFSDFWSISTEQFQCGVFTTDASLVDSVRSLNIITKSISISELYEWQKNKRKVIRESK
jgi:hypothetical protein